TNEAQLPRARAWEHMRLWVAHAPTRTRGVVAKSRACFGVESIIGQLRRSVRGAVRCRNTQCPPVEVEGLSSIREVFRRPDLLELFHPSMIRNFSIIAHIDHGKSTLADSLLVRTGSVSERYRKDSPQMLDTLKVERDRGITVKAQTASMLHGPHLLNLIDTPGHVDFSYEVIRSLSACQGALLLVDSTQGVQAQTLSTAKAAMETGLKLVPVVTKIDLPHANIEDAILSVATNFDLDPEEVIPTSAKTGEGIDQRVLLRVGVRVLNAVVERIPPPPRSRDRNTPLRARLVDSWYDTTRGVICLVEVVDGKITEQDRIVPYHLAFGDKGGGGAGATVNAGGESFSVQEVGLLVPVPTRTGALFPGQVGYIIAGMRSTSQAVTGDTIIPAGGGGSAPPKPLAPIQPSKSMLFASVYPLDDGDFESLIGAVERLALNDASLEWERENSTALGLGLRMGFLGVLHMEVFHQRLVDEFNTPVLLTAPTVPYRCEPIDWKNKDITPFVVVNLADWPNPTPTGGGHGMKFKVLEPMVDATVITPSTCLGSMLALFQERRGRQIHLKYLDDTRVLLQYRMPWQEVIGDLNDQAKNISSGYASFDYREAEPEAGDLVKVDIAVNGESVDALSFICHRDKAQRLGRDVAKRLKEVISRQQFEVVIHARLGVKPFAKERIPPYRKDVLTKSGKTVGGGDVSRKKKLLEKQKKGKLRAKTVGKVQLGQEAFWSVLSASPGSSKS
ncbi:unnamed protein product, partial [Discosporangium mesarthrocarpum]